MKIIIAIALLVTTQVSGAMETTDQNPSGYDLGGQAKQSEVFQEYTQIHEFTLFKTAKYITLKISNSDSRVLVKSDRMDPNKVKPEKPMSSYYTKNDYFDYCEPYSRKMLEDEYKYGMEGCYYAAFQSLFCWTLGKVDRSELEQSVFKVELSTNSIPSFIFNREIPFYEFISFTTLDITQRYDPCKVEFIVRPLNRETAHLKQICESILKDHETDQEGK